MNILFNKNLKYIIICITVISLSGLTYLFDHIFFDGEPTTITFLEQLVYSLFNLGMMYLHFGKRSCSPRPLLFCMLIYGLTLQISDICYAYNYYFTDLKDENIYLWLTTTPLGITFASVSLSILWLTKNIYLSEKNKPQNYFIVFSCIVIFFIVYKMFIEIFPARYGHENIFPNHFIRISPVLFGGTAAILGLISLVRSDFSNNKFIGLGAFIHAISDFALRSKSYVQADVFYGIGEYTYFIGVSFVCLSCIDVFRVEKKQIFPSINHTRQSILVSTILTIFVIGFQFFDDFKTIEFLLSSVSLMTVSIFISSQIVSYQIERVYVDFSNKRYYEKSTPSEFHKIRALILDKQKSESIAKLMTNMSHEFKYPLELTSMALNAHERIAGKDNIISKTAPGIRQGIASGMNLITTLMNMSKTNYFPNIQEVSATKLLYDCIVGASAMNRKKNYKIQLNICHDFNILCDETSIASALRNLISNGMQAMPDTSKHILTIDLIQICGWVRFQVTNTGSYIDNSSLKHIFDSFYTQNKPSGNGLGLAIAKKSALENKAKIWCSSESKTPSTTFYLEVPCSKTPDKTERTFFSTSKEFLDEVFCGAWNID